MTVGSDIKAWWDELLSKTLVLRFRVTDRALAGETLHRLRAGQFDPLPGLEIKDIVLADTAERGLELIRDLRGLVEKHDCNFGV